MHPNTTPKQPLPRHRQATPLTAGCIIKQAAPNSHQSFNNLESVLSTLRPYRLHCRKNRIFLSFPLSALTKQSVPPCPSYHLKSNRSFPGKSTPSTMPSSSLSTTYTLCFISTLSLLTSLNMRGRLTKDVDSGIECMERV
jgi:hypothetical protein